MHRNETIADPQVAPLDFERAGVWPGNTWGTTPTGRKQACDGAPGRAPVRTAFQQIPGLCCTLILVELLTGVTARGQDEPDDAPKAFTEQVQRSEIRQFVVSNSFQLSAMVNTPFSRYELDFPLPASTERQVIDELTLTNTPFPGARTLEPITTLPYGNALHRLVVTEQPVPPNARLCWTARVETANLQFDPKKAAQVPLSALAKLKGMDRFLQPEERVQSQNPNITRTLVKIFPQPLRAEDSIYGAARKIYDYVLAHAAYKLNRDIGRPGTLYGACDLLERGVGECGDYAALFVALCRAAGIPAVAEVGSWLNKGHFSPHCWAKFYLPDFGWIPVDPSMGDLPLPGRSRSKKLVADRYFGMLPDLNQRLVLAIGYDQKHPHRDYNFMQTYAYWYWYRGEKNELRVQQEFRPRRLQQPEENR